MKRESKPSRATVLHAVTETILARKDGQIPADVEGIDEFFNSAEDVAEALLLRWHTHLTASLERGLVGDPEDRHEMVIQAWLRATDTYMGVRMLIDNLAENPPTEGVANAVRVTARNDWAAMAVAAGLASDFHEPAARVGHRLELEARQRLTRSRTPADRERRPRTILGKIRARLIS